MVLQASGHSKTVMGKFMTLVEVSDTLKMLLVATGNLKKSFFSIEFRGPLNFPNGLKEGLKHL